MKLRTAIPLLFLSLCLLGTLLISLTHGTIHFNLTQVIGIISQKLGFTNTSFTAIEQAIVWDIRFPRALLAALVGSGLATSGVAMQSLFRNPLADPALLGVSSGAALTTVIFIVLGTTWTLPITQILGIYSLPIIAFIGGLTTTLLVYFLARVEEHQLTTSTLLLIGVAINVFFGALTNLLTYFADDQQLRTLIFWTMGSVGNATWQQVIACFPFILIGIILFIYKAQALNVLLLGEKEAGHLGFDVHYLKLLLLLTVACTVGACVAVSGIVGFIGLIVPHLARLLFGMNHHLLLPGAALLGANLLMAADILTRILLPPAELPLGVITALLGSPFFLWLLWQNRLKYSLS